MMDITYDPEADAAYIKLGGGDIERQEVRDPIIYDLDAQGRIVGIEILSASRVLAPGDWQKARVPGSARAHAAE